MGPNFDINPLGSNDDILNVPLLLFSPLFIISSSIPISIHLSPKIPLLQHLHCPLSQSPTRKSPTTRALIRWQEYKEAIKDKDLAQTFRFLKSVKSLPLQSSLDGSSSAGLSQLQSPKRDWEVLDAYLNADDMKLVSSAYKFPHYRGFLPNIGKCKNIGGNMTRSRQLFQQPQCGCS